MRITTYFAAIILAAFATVAAPADITVNLDLLASNSNDGEGDPTNLANGDVFVIEVGDDDYLYRIAWDFGYFPFGASLHSHVNFGIGDTYTGSVGLAGAYVTPAAGDNTGGLKTHSSGGWVTFASLGYGGFALTDSNSDGSNDFYVEIFESVVDVPDAAEGLFGNQSVGSNPSGLRGLDFNAIPEPASALCIALFGLGVAIRRRRM